VKPGTPVSLPVISLLPSVFTESLLVILIFLLFQS